MADTTTNQEEVQSDQSSAESTDETAEIASQVDQLQQELEQARQAQEQMLAQTQRTLADYANLKKRVERERDDLRQFATEMALVQLLPAVDNLERAVALASEADQKSSIFVGVKMTLHQLHDAFDQLGLQRLKVEPGVEFDPHLHEAVESVAGAQGQIVEVLTAGYKLHDKIVRPAQVKVGSGQ